MVAFWKEIRIRPRADGVPGASQPFPPIQMPLEDRNVPPAHCEPSVSSAESNTCGLPGPELFGYSMVPSSQHTWQNILVLNPGSEKDPEPRQGRAVTATLIEPVWQLVQGHNKGREKGGEIPRYDECFQGF